jgi:hypothetical protein
MNPAVEATSLGEMTGPRMVDGSIELIAKFGFFSSLNFQRAFSASVLLAQ